MPDVSLTITGTTTRDVELRYTAGGQAVANVSVAVNDRKKEGDRWVDGEPTFFAVTLWGTLAENAAASIFKGTRVNVIGRIKSRKYENKDGNESIAWDVTADAFGPDLRWCTVEVEKNERAKPTANRPPDPVFGDEEPF